MPLSKENRHLLEVAIICHLRFGVKEATSKDLYHYLKSTGILALRGVKQVSMICSCFERRGALLSRRVKVKEKRRTYRKKAWRANPDFYKGHPDQSMFSAFIPEVVEMRHAHIRKRRMRKI